MAAGPSPAPSHGPPRPSGPELERVLDHNGLRLLRSINRGGWGNGDVHLVERDGRRMVLKTYAERRAPIRWLGSRLLARERRAYRALLGVRGVPQILPLADRRSLLLEYVEGRRISDVLPGGGGEAVVASLRGLLAELHRRGVHHMDLRSRGNLLVDAGLQVWVLDFASAVIVRSRNPLGRLLSALCRRIDYRGLRKWHALATQAGAP